MKICAECKLLYEDELVRSPDEDPKFLCYRCFFYFYQFKKRMDEGEASKEDLLKMKKFCKKHGPLANIFFIKYWLDDCELLYV